MRHSESQMKEIQVRVRGRTPGVTAVSKVRRTKTMEDRKEGQSNAGSEEQNPGNRLSKIAAIYGIHLKICKSEITAHLRGANM